jgi:hypothetical protein
MLDSHIAGSLAATGCSSLVRRPELIFDCPLLSMSLRRRSLRL